MTYSFQHTVSDVDSEGTIASMSDGQRKGPEPVVPLKGEDAFWLTDLYPDAKALFEHNHAPLNEVVADAIVVLDANVLLLPFEFTKASIAEVERVYALIAEAGRLVVPGQAAREYYKHRSKKIAAIANELDAAIGKAKRQIFEKPIPLLEGDEDYQAARELGAEFINKGKEVAEKLQAVNERLQNDIGEDRVSALYRKLLGDCVVEVEVCADSRKAIIEEVARRARLHIAPGFKDQNKEDGGIGDYLVWKAILQEGAARQRHCIFVTEEEKPDWWVKRQGTFQPRPELIDEYRQASQGRSIHLLPLSALLATFKAADTTVSEVQRLEEKKKETVSKNELTNRKLAEAERKIELTTVQYMQDDLIKQIDQYDEMVRQLTDDFTRESEDSIQELIWNKIQLAHAGRSRAFSELQSLVEKYPTVSNYRKVADVLRSVGSKLVATSFP